MWLCLAEKGGLLAQQRLQHEPLPHWAGRHLDDADKEGMPGSRPLVTLCSGLDRRVDRTDSTIVTDTEVAGGSKIGELSPCRA